MAARWCSEMLGKDGAGMRVPTSGTSPSMEEAVCAWWWLLLCPWGGSALAAVMEACAVESNKLPAVRNLLNPMMAPIIIAPCICSLSLCSDM